MNKITKLFLPFAAVVALTIPVLGASTGDWKLHPSFDQYIIKVIDTPSKVYLQSYNQLYNVSYANYSSPYPTLFVYDKESDELQNFNKRNYLSDNIVVFADYNADKNYLLISYDTGDIDIVYDNGDVFNIPALKNSTLPYGKSVVTATFDPENNLAYLAMNFGYLVIDDKKGEIKESRVFDKKINAIGRVGDYLVMADESKIYSAPASKPYPALSDFSPLDGITYVVQILPLDNNKFAYIGTDKKVYLTELDENGDLASVTLKYSAAFNSITGNKNGYFIAGNDRAVQVGKDGNLTLQMLDAADKSTYVGSWDGKEYWFGKGRTGLYSKKFDSNVWTTTREAVTPNAPSAFQCEYIVPTSKYGMLVVNHGYNKSFTANNIEPNLLCSYNNGEWTQLGPAWRNNKYEKANMHPCGLAVDPDDEKYVYSGSFSRGYLRQNIEDPEDLIQMSSPTTKFSDISFYQSIPTNAASASYAYLNTPSFDTYGNLWGYYNWNNGGGVGRLLYMKGSDKRAGIFDNWGNIDLKESSHGPDNKILALRTAANKNYVVIFTGQNESDLIIFDHNGTLDDTSDDRIAYMGDIYDQDGSKVSKNCIHNFYEDTDGTVWALTDFGVFTFNPSEAFSNPSRVNRIKVTRNDGTNLADYLLDGVNTWQMTADAQGHKWFATAGAGLVCTSADGREIISSYTSDNSFIPDNTVYSVAYNPQSGSIMMSTQKGIAEYFPAGAKTADDMDSIKIYPNPVRPDYFGYVTIEGLVDNALVKIVDASGNLVSELGLAAGGVAQWDVANAQHQRVHTGVYYVLASSSASDTNVAKVGQILVVN